MKVFFIGFILFIAGFIVDALGLSILGQILTAIGFTTVLASFYFIVEGK